MKKEDIAKNLYELINLYDDYINTGLKNEHENIVFSFVNNNSGLDQIKNKKDIHNKKEEIVDITEKKKNIIKLSETILKCKECSLCENSKKITGIGSVSSKIFIITLPPSEEEEISARPMVGKTGEFFKKWIEAINLNVDELFITNIIKCPQKKRKLSKEMLESCRIYLDSQIELINPKIIISLGQLTLSFLKKSYFDLIKYHGEIFYYNNFPVIPIFHPEKVQLEPELKKIVWEDLKKFKKIYESMLD